MSFSRWWTEATAALGDVLPLPLVALLLLLVTALVALAWYTFPAWVPRRWPRLRRRRKRGKPATERDELAEAPDDLTPAELDPEPEPDLASARPDGDLADRLAAQGRYAEAIRERLRDMVRDLIAYRVLEHRPGLTVAELADAAARVRPPVRDPFAEAGRIFSELWYGQRPAGPAHDDRMRQLAAELRSRLAGPPGYPAPPTGGPGHPAPPTGGPGHPAPPTGGPGHPGPSGAAPPPRPVTPTAPAGEGVVR